MTYTTEILFFIAGINVVLVLTAETTWIESMATCAKNDQAPTLPGENTSEETWVGKARYNMSWGILTIQIEEKRRNEKNCFGILPHINETILFFKSMNGRDFSPALAELIKIYLFIGTGNGDKCTFADFSEQTIKYLPKPSDCLMIRGNTSEYVSCEMYPNDGCKKIENSLELSITLSSTDTSGGFCITDKKCSVVDVRMDRCLLLVIEQYMNHLVGLGCLLVILNITLICSCARCQKNREKLPNEDERGKESVRRPCSETIERTYINRDLSNQNDTYDAMTDMNQSSDTTLQILQRNMQDYDIGISRSAKSNSGDYDLAWAEGSWSAAVASPDINYAHVEIIRKQKMDAVPEEEIYSKQNLTWEDVQDDTEQSKKFKTEGGKRVQITDDKTSCNANDESVNIRDQIQRLKTKYTQNVCDNVYSTVKIIGMKQLNTQEEIQRKNEKHVERIKLTENGSCFYNTTAGVKVSMCKTKQDKLAEPSVKKTPHKVTSKNLPEVQNGSRITGSMNDKVGTRKENPVEALYNNLIKTDDTTKTQSPEREEKMVDEGRTVLRANTNKVVMETKL